MKKNFPNYLIILRMLLIPVFLVLLISAGPGEDWLRFAAMVVFTIAAVSDFFDGHLARKWNVVSNFGKLMDPLADKMLVTSALVALVYRAELAAWVVIVMICRDLLVNALRMLSLEQGRDVIAASIWGKTKTVLQMWMIIVFLGGMGRHTPGVFEHIGWGIFADVVMYLAVAATVLSALDYWRGFRKSAKAARDGN